MIWLARLAAACVGAAIMWLEGRMNPTPGVGFVIGSAFIFGAALVGRKDDDYWSWG